MKIKLKERKGTKNENFRKKNEKNKAWTAGSFTKILHPKKKKNYFLKYYISKIISLNTTSIQNIKYFIESCLLLPYHHYACLTFC